MTERMTEEELKTIRRFTEAISLRSDAVGLAGVYLSELLDERDRLAAESERLREWLEDNKTKNTPWPETVWIMTTDDYCRAVPNDQLRTGISGFLMREGWRLAIRDLRRALQPEPDDKEEPK